MNAGAAIVRSPRRRRHSRSEVFVEEILEEIVEEVKDVAEAFVEELVEADDGDTFFLDMGLARGMSILPDDVVCVAEATAPETTMVIPIPTTGNREERVTDPEAKPLITTNEIDVKLIASKAMSTTPTSAYILLVTAVMSLSSVGPLLNLQSGVNPLLKIYWWMSGTAMALVPFTGFSVYRDGLPTTLHGPQLFTLFLTAASYATMGSGFVMALEYTSVGNTVILSNSQSILLLVGKIFVGQRILALEAAGAILAFCGAALCSQDLADRGSPPSLSGNDMNNTYDGHNLLTLWGDFLALVDAMGGVCYLVFAKTIRPHISLYLFMFLIMLLGSTLILIFMIITMSHDGEITLTGTSRQGFGVG